MKLPLCLVIVILLMLASTAYSATDSFFIFGDVGRAGLSSPRKPRVPSSMTEPESSTSKGGSWGAGFGRRWNYFAFEAFYKKFGTMSHTLTDLYEEKYSGKAYGGGLRWIISYFTIRLGWLGSTIERTTTYDKNLTATVSRPEGSEKFNPSGGYFGLGLNLPLLSFLDLNFEITGYAFDLLRKEITITDGGNSATSAHDDPLGIGEASMGIRLYF